MLIYTLAIGLLFGVSTVISRHKPRPHYPIAYEIFENVAVILMFVGNLLYAFAYVTPLLRKLWKFVFPLVIASVVASALVTPHFDSTFQKHGPVAHIVTWILVVGIFFASFRANFLIGYGDVERVRTIERPAAMSEDPLQNLVREMTRMRRTAQISWVLVIVLLALVAFNSFFQLHIEPKSDSWMTVRRLADRGKYAEALPIARHLIEKDPDSPDLWVLMGNLQLSLGQLHQAEGSYTRAYELLPNQVTSSLLNAVRLRIDQTDPTPTPTASP
jgi:tetratricopeptide (TPR) repeat protein